ncbi:hypothetical protein BCR33DRAFT_715261 [Rhizoclosmatium globosum]|uniref:Uncharacterized protein n=1 Tax=Rhizoclosmatium globosum TaxID=329046 RepID=A0A1Y2CIG6_9FUNG|nr:hypothetical protein BCR33DRAFT_715261 [Rhizoclosmatium globosum]|eukprot:ORY46840.1 hypothetical protein BCR33DRAFT_715261 [Rhizoclosmatium globosum]
MNEVPTNWPRERTVPAWIPSAPMNVVKPNRLMDRLKQIFESRTKLCKFRIIKKPAAGSNGIQALNIIKPNGEGRSNYNVQHDKSDDLNLDSQQEFTTQPPHSRFALLSTYCEIMDTLTSLLESHPDTITSKCKPVKAFSVSQEYMTFLLELLDTPVAADENICVASFNTCSESLKTFVLGSPALLFRNESTLLHSVSELE